jgi:bifunctional DNA-binding transcriptional regulator/antitoxin component of YhaV-PrlF toxin-antitoxin module
MGDRGRVVIPADLRERHHLDVGVPLVLIETRRGLILISREQLKELVQQDLSGEGMLAELLAERRRQAAADDVA